MRGVWEAMRDFSDQCPILTKSPLLLRGSTRDVFMDWLQAKRPDLMERYEELYARGGYLSAAERRALEARLPRRRRAETDKRFQRPPEPAQAPRERRREEVRQTTLF